MSSVPRNTTAGSGLVMSRSSSQFKEFLGWLGTGFLFLVTSLSLLAVLFIFYFIAKDAVPYFANRGVAELFTGMRWQPTDTDMSFGALPLFYGSAVVTLGAIIVAVPIGVCAAICLSDILPFGLRQVVKPVIEILASIPSVAFGFFALVVFAPVLQDHGPYLLGYAVWVIGLPCLGLATFVGSDLATNNMEQSKRSAMRIVAGAAIAVLGLLAVYLIADLFFGNPIRSGTNAFNACIILGIMALPTVVSVSEDALQAAGRELREASYGMGATRAETLVKVILPAASSGILAAVILGIMRAIGETMVVWMASGNAAQIPAPFYDIFEPVRTLTATIAAEMGETDHTAGAMHYSVLFALAFCLLVFCFACNIISELIIKRSRRKLRGE
jgi:phosphate transport system permease protein